MNAFRQRSGALIWEPLLSSEELKKWVLTRKKPRQLYKRGQISRPIVYRLIFTPFVDENGAHTPCYVGEGGDIQRLSNHMRLDMPTSITRKYKGKTLPGGWWVRGAVRKSGGDLRLEILKIEGCVNIAGITLSQSSLDDVFARRLLENWAILYARDTEGLRPYNRGISQSGKDLLRKLKASRNRKPKRINNKPPRRAAPRNRKSDGR
jgi:hypothetical protein